MSRLTIWCNAALGERARTLLEKGIGGHRLIYSNQLAASNLVAGGRDEQLAEAEVAFGQPDPSGILESARLRWSQLTSAGYTRYDTNEFRDALRLRGSRLTNSSAVYAEPCAEHVLALLLAQARQLPQCVETQCRDRSWPAAQRRAESRLLLGQKVLLLGFGSIGRRLAQLLVPFGIDLSAIRRQVGADPGVKFVTEEQAGAVFAEADHVINLLPENAATLGFMNAARFESMKAGACFYNVGRGTTVDQAALLAGLQSGALGAAYLDVTNPEPLPPEHPLWSAPNCWITPHAAGGHANEQERLVEHFLTNLARFECGDPLEDQVI